MRDYVKVIADSVVIHPSGCHEWKRYRLPSGYGRTRYHGENILAHRLAWIVVNGPIPAGRMVLHSCDNPSCCNVAHLFLGDAKANHDDMVSKGRRRSGDMTHRRIYKLTDAQVLEIRSGAQSGVALARKFGVTQACISQIRSGTRKVAAP